MTSTSKQKRERVQKGGYVMDVEIEAPVDDLEALFEVEDEETLGDAAGKPSNDPTACG